MQLRCGGRIFHLDPHSTWPRCLHLQLAPEESAAARRAAADKAVTDDDGGAEAAEEREKRGGDPEAGWISGRLLCPPDVDPRDLAVAATWERFDFGGHVVSPEADGSFLIPGIEPTVGWDLVVFVHATGVVLAWIDAPEVCRGRVAKVEPIDLRASVHAVTVSLDAGEGGELRAPSLEILGVKGPDAEQWRPVLQDSQVRTHSLRGSSTLHVIKRRDTDVIAVAEAEGRRARKVVLRRGAPVIGLWRE